MTPQKKISKRYSYALFASKICSKSIRVLGQFIYRRKLLRPFQGILEIFPGFHGNAEHSASLPRRFSAVNGSNVRPKYLAPLGLFFLPFRWIDHDDDGGHSVHCVALLCGPPLIVTLRCCCCCVFCRCCCYRGC